MPCKVLVYSDSRGQHTPSGLPVHQVFGERLAQLDGVEAELVLCPMKWTSLVDFLDYLHDHPPERYDWIVLYAGIVDWSPRPKGSAFNDLYNNQNPLNAGNRGLNTRDYTKKVVNNKKALFDAIFGEAAMLAHLNRGSAVEFEGEPTVNMYGLEMAERHLLPKLAELENLIFINANRFVVGWEGDYTRGRPANISVVERYSALFRERLGHENVIDLLQWSDEEIKRYTCDNLHLTREGSDWIFEKVVARMSHRAKVRKMTEEIECELDLNEDQRAIDEFRRAFESPPQLKTFLQKRSTSEPIQALQTGHVDGKYLRLLSFLFDRKTIENIAAMNVAVAEDQDLKEIVKEMSASPRRLESYIAASFAHYKKRHEQEYRYLALFNPGLFPYNYPSGYSYSAELSKENASRSIDFIYCIKNRRERVALSLQSLEWAYKKYADTSGNRITARAVVVEDISPDMFDPSTVEHQLDINHIIVNTGVHWTRSGLLNIGIKSSDANGVAFVDADFLFHADFFFSLENVISRVSLEKHVLAVNLIETECHRKGPEIYSKASPYSYMWLAPRWAVVKVHGFDEGYVGHGSEDRDLELKLTRVAGLRVTDTASLDPAAVVLHLSHSVRDGYGHHDANKARYLERLNAPDSRLLIQDVWGEAPVLHNRHYSGAQGIITQPVHIPARGEALLTAEKRAYRTVFMVISCCAYAERQHLLREHYKDLSRDDLAVFVVGGSSETTYDSESCTLHLKCGDMYEDLPEKVLYAIEFCAKNFRFRSLIKVDDDVVVNLDLASKVVASGAWPYFGKMIPSRRGAKPSPVWHFGKVSQRSPHFDKPFTFEGGPPNWACGGMYMLSASSAYAIAQNAANVATEKYLYEDHMIGSILFDMGIEPVFIEESEEISAKTWILTDIRSVMNGDFTSVVDSETTRTTIGFHCGPFPPLYNMPRDKCLHVMRKLMSFLKVMQRQDELEKRV